MTPTAPALAAAAIELAAKLAAWARAERERQRAITEVLLKLGEK